MTPAIAMICKPGGPTAKRKPSPESGFIHEALDEAALAFQ